MIKQAYRTGAQAALKKFGLDDTASTPYTMEYQQPSTNGEGQPAMIDQAFATNENLGEDGHPSDSFVSAVNNVLTPGMAAGEEGRHFSFPTDQSGGDL